MTKRSDGVSTKRKPQTEAQVMDREHRRKVQELKATLPVIPYPLSSWPNLVTRWRKQATEAGYPLCETCGRPISRDRWEASLTECLICYRLRVGVYEYQDEETRYNDGY